MAGSTVEGRTHRTELKPGSTPFSRGNDLSVSVREESFPFAGATEIECVLPSAHGKDERIRTSTADHRIRVRISEEVELPHSMVNT